jgi:chemotaxis protein MotA
MTPEKKRSKTRIGAGALPLGIAVLFAGQWLAGGHAASLFQLDAALVVFGGTFAALAISYPGVTLRRAVAAIPHVFASPKTTADALVARFTDFAIRVRKRGVMTLESEIPKAGEPFLARTLGLLVDGVSADDLRLALRTASEAMEDADDELAEVYEAAGGYAPTLGILGAVLGLMHVMENLTAPSKLGAGIAVAFVATVYGVASANLVFLPIAMRLRVTARDRAVRRQAIIAGAVALQQGMHPRLLEAQLDGFMRGAQRMGKVA